MNLTASTAHQLINGTRDGADPIWYWHRGPTWGVYRVSNSQHQSAFWRVYYIRCLVFRFNSMISWLKCSFYFCFAFECIKNQLVLFKLKCYSWEGGMYHDPLLYNVCLCVKNDFKIPLYWMVQGEKTFLICCSVMNHLDLSDGLPGKCMILQ